jgi:hypothetical protein
MSPWWADLIEFSFRNGVLHIGWGFLVIVVLALIGAGALIRGLS